VFQTRTIKKLKILDWDIENRPLSYLGQDYTTGEVTSIAWSWLDEEEVHCEVLTPEIEKSTRTMFERFLEVYDRADIVTGHYIRKHDLPVVSGAMLEYGYKLSEKLASDTKLDLIKAKYLSASQESLAGMFDLPAHKHHMSQPEWRKANRLAPEGIEATKKRVVDDVLQHKQLRAKLVEVGALKQPRVWYP
jgi:hypothetical protein